MGATQSHGPLLTVAAQTGRARRVWYVEARGEGALTALQPLLKVLGSRAGFQGGELQVSPSQPGLALLVSRWQGEVPEVPLPPGARAWSFEILESG